MNIADLTLGQIKQINALAINRPPAKANGLDDFAMGKDVVI
jgi:hypothetical protein